MNVPKLRFKGFGSEWCKDSLKKKFSKIRNGFVGIATPYYVDEGIKYLQGKNIKYGQIDSDGLIYVSAEFHKKYSNSVLQKNDILMVQSGHVGQCAVVTENYINANCHALIILSPNNTEKINSHFVSYFFQCYLGKKVIYKIKTGNTIEHVLASDIKNVEIFFPTYSEQQKIASFLSSVDEKITQLTKKHELLCQYKKGMMQKLFSQEIRFKDDDGTKYLAWNLEKIKNIFYTYRPGLLSKKDISKDGKDKCIHYGELFTTYKEIICTIKSRTDINNAFVGKVGDILMPSSDVTPNGLAKASALMVDDVVLGGDMNILRPKGLISSIFFSYLINFYKEKIISQVTGTTIKHIYMRNIENLEYIIPSIKEQTKIANFLSSIDDKIESVAQQIEQAKLWKKGLLQQMFV